MRAAQKVSGREKGFPVSVSLRRAITHMARLHAKVARQRHDFLHQTQGFTEALMKPLCAEILTEFRQIAEEHECLAA